MSIPEVPVRGVDGGIVSSLYISGSRTDLLLPW